MTTATISPSLDAAIIPEATQPVIYAVKEHEHIAIPASDILRGGSLVVFPSVMQRRYFSVLPGVGPLKLQAGGFIGLIPLNERVTIDVRSRVPIGNLTHVLRISGEPFVALEGSRREYETETELYPSLLDLYARTLCDHVEDIKLRGMYREYVRNEEATSFPRGRILIGETITSLASKGVTHKLATSWFQRTADVPANRCLKYAIWLLAQIRSTLAAGQQKAGDRAITSALNSAYHAFDGIELDSSCDFLRDQIVTGGNPLPSLRAYYRNPLDLARAIIERRALTLQGGGKDLVMPSFVINMSDVFEEYLRNMLSIKAAQHQWSSRVLNGEINQPHGGQKRLFTTGSEHRDASPDILIATGSSLQGSLVLEVKYKPADKIDRPDLNQAIAYGVSYGSSHVILVQPKGTKASPASGLHELGTIGSMTVHQYVFDMNATDLDAEELAFAYSMRELCPEL